MTTEDGQEPIEEIEVGDKVLSEDETTGEVAVKTVTESYVNETDELIHIGVNGEIFLLRRHTRSMLINLVGLAISLNNVKWWYSFGSGVA